ncbi:MAG: MFS transporter [bacterium]
MTSLRGNPVQGLIGATLGFFIGFAAVALYGPAAKNFKELMGLSGFMLGLLVAIPQLTGSLLRIPFGAWVDKVGGRIPFLTLFALSIIGMSGLLFILFNYYPQKITKDLYGWILLFGALSGCGVATFSVGIPQTSYWFPKSKQGSALAIYAGLGNLAPGIFTLILPFAIAYLGLPKAYLMWFIFFIIGVIAYYLIAVDSYYFQLIKQGESKERAIKISQEKGLELFPTGNVVQALAKSAQNFKTWLLVLLYFTSFGGFLALTTWLPSVLTIYYGVSLKTAGMITALGFSILASLARVAYGFITDKIGGELSNIIAFIITLLGAIILTFSNVFMFSLVGIIITALGMGFANAAVFKLVPKYVPEAVGGASGWIGGLGAFGGFTIPPLLGVIVDKIGHEGYHYGFAIYIILALICLGISLYLKQLKT